MMICIELAPRCIAEFLIAYVSHEAIRNLMLSNARMVVPTSTHLISQVLRTVRKVIVKVTMFLKPFICN